MAPDLDSHDAERLDGAGIADTVRDLARLHLRLLLRLLCYWADYWHFADHDGCGTEPECFLDYSAVCRSL